MASGSVLTNDQLRWPAPTWSGNGGHQFVEADLLSGQRLKRKSQSGENPIVVATKQAFVLRVAPSRADRLPEALASDEIIIGWSNLPRLRDESLEWEQFRGLIADEYHSDDSNLRRAGRAAGDAWRFIRDLKIGDLVVVPSDREFFVARVEGSTEYRPDKVKEDTAFRRKVVWLNGKEGIERSLARAKLQSRMKYRGTCANATDLLDEIEACLEIAGKHGRPEFGADLRKTMIDAAVREMRGGRLDSYGFERLVAAVMRQQGASNVKIVPRRQDKGADILATFQLAGAFSFVVAIQAKHYQHDPPVGPSVVEELIRGIEAESANLGMVVTCGAFCHKAKERAQWCFDNDGLRVELVDGELLAAMIVDGGLSVRTLLE